MATEKAIAKKQSKAEILSTITETSKLPKAYVKAVLDALANCACGHLKKGGSGEFVVPELAVKLRRVEKPATNARKGRVHHIHIAVRPEAGRFRWLQPALCALALIPYR